MAMNLGLALLSSLIKFGGNFQPFRASTIIEGLLPPRKATISHYRSIKTDLSRFPQLVVALRSSVPAWELRPAMRLMELRLREVEQNNTHQAEARAAMWTCSANNTRVPLPGFENLHSHLKHKEYHITMWYCTDSTDAAMQQLSHRFSAAEEFLLDTSGHTAKLRSVLNFEGRYAGTEGRRKRYCDGSFNRCLYITLPLRKRTTPLYHLS